MAYYVYVSIGGEERIAIYDMDTDTGALELKDSADAGGAVGALAVSPDKRFLYAAIRSTTSVTTFAIDSGTGGRSQLGSVPVFDNPVYVFIDNSGKFLVMSSYSGDTAGAYPIGDDGTVQDEASTLQETRRNPHSIQLDPSNRFGFVPNTGSDCIFQYVWDSEAGTLTPNDVPIVDTAEGTGPRHFAFYPGKNYVYFVNEKGNSIDAFNLDEGTGQLSHFQHISTLPDDFDDESFCADIHFTPDGKYLYATNRGHESLAGYSVDAETGELTFLGTYPTEAHPRSFAIDPPGNFVYCAGQDSDRMASYRINHDTGELEPLEIYGVGKAPGWVTVLELP